MTHKVGANMPAVVPRPTCPNSPHENSHSAAQKISLLMLSKLPKSCPQFKLHNLKGVVTGLFETDASIDGGGTT